MLIMRSNPVSGEIILSSCVDKWEQQLSDIHAGSGEKLNMKNQCWLFHPVLCVIFNVKR